MDLAAYEQQLVDFRKRGSWDEAYALLEPLIVSSTPAAAGWAKVQCAYTRYLQSTEYAPLSLALTDQALTILARNTRDYGCAAIMGVYYAETARDVDRMARYALILRALLRTMSVEVIPWVGRIQAALAEYYRFAGDPVRELAALEECLAFYEQNEGPWGEHDRQCRVEGSIAAIGSAKLRMGLITEATECLNRLLARSTAPTNPPALHLFQGQVAFALGNLDEAEQLLKTALAEASAWHWHSMETDCLEVLVLVFRQMGRNAEVPGLLRPYIMSAAQGRLTRTLLHYQRLQAAA